MSSTNSHDTGHGAFMLEALLEITGRVSINAVAIIFVVLFYLFVYCPAIFFIFPAILWSISAKKA